MEFTTLWDFPSQNYGIGWQGSTSYKGATPSYIVWNLLKRYTHKNDLVLDPMCGSGTTMDVASDLERRAIGFDLTPVRPEIKQCDARHLPLQHDSVDFVFIDPPYSDHIHYSDDPRCIGNLGAHDPKYYEAMEDVLHEAHRVLKKEHCLTLYVSDSFVAGKPFCPIGFELFSRMRQWLAPVDIVAVTRRNRALRDIAADPQSAPPYLLRGFHYLFIMRKE
jgi:DNA modification methylase